MEMFSDIPKKRIKRSNEELALEAKKFLNKADFQKYGNSSYKAAWRRGPEFLNKICSHMETLWAPKWDTIEEVHAEALKYDERTLFARGSSGAYDKGQREGWLPIVCAHMGEKCNEAYTKEGLLAIGRSCSSKEEMRNRFGGSYSAAWKLGILDEIFSGTEDLWEIKWDTKEKIHLVALKYDERTLFKYGSSGAWDAAQRMGIMDEVCSHMKKSRNSSNPERALMATVKTLRPSAKKNKDMKVKIEGKPYIHGFDIDIFVPELNLGIEFDGKYHHSFEYMRKDTRKSKWSDEDIHRYHDLKDEWFATKGIRILHIKEEEWNIDKEACIKRCFIFLGGFYEPRTP